LDDNEASKPDKDGVPPSEREARANLTHALSNTKKAGDEQARAQNRAADKTATATIFIAFFTFVTIGVGGAQWWTLTGTLNEMRDEQRPWLKAVPKIVGPLFSKGGLLSTDIEIDVNNVGRSPASGVRGAAIIINGGHGLITKDDLHVVCDRAATSAILDQDSASDLIFPNGGGRISAQAADQKAYGNGNRALPTGQATVENDVALVFCVSYLNAGNEPTRHTGGAFAIDGAKSGTVLKDGEMIDPSGLRLESSPFDLKWRSYAD
jgi:hypothetical protein